jgi:hypothetical protein
LNSTLSNAVWERRPVSVKPTAGQFASSMVYSPDDDVVFLHGSQSGWPKNYVYCPTESTLTTKQVAAGCNAANDWAEVTPAGGIYPTAVSFVGMWYETRTRKIVLYGGQTGGGAVQNEVWAYDIPTRSWARKCNGCTAPPAAAAADIGKPSMAYDSVRGRFYYRQVVGAGAPRDWMYDPVADAWTVLTSNLGPVPALSAPDGSGPVDSMAIGFHPITGKLVAFVYDGPFIWHGELK